MIITLPETKGLEGLVRAKQELLPQGLIEVKFLLDTQKNTHGTMQILGLSWIWCADDSIRRGTLVQ
jgi:hypothetical protein